MSPPIREVTHECGCQSLILRPSREVVVKACLAFPRCEEGGRIARSCRAARVLSGDDEVLPDT